MTNILTNPKSAAIAGLVLCLPFAFLLTLLLLDVSPTLGAVQPLLVTPDPDAPDVVGTLLAVGIVLLVVAAFLLNLLQVVRAAQSRQSVAARPMNLVLTVVTLAAIAMVIGGIIADQYPCWVGVPKRLS